MLGLEGLALDWPASIRSKSKEEVCSSFSFSCNKFINNHRLKIREALESANIDESRRKIREAISPKAQLTLSVDASPLFTSDEKNVMNNIKRLHVIPQKITYSTEVPWPFFFILHPRPNALNTERDQQKDNTIAKSQKSNV